MYGVSFLYIKIERWRQAYHSGVCIFQLLRELFQAFITELLLLGLDVRSFVRLDLFRELDRRFS
jgi:hypothetical protein